MSFVSTRHIASWSSKKSSRWLRSSSTSKYVTYSQQRTQACEANQKKCSDRTTPPWFSTLLPSPPPSEDAHNRIHFHFFFTVWMELHMSEKLMPSRNSSL